MKALNCIFGIFSVIAAILFFFHPGISFLNTGWIVAALLGAWGICAILNFVSNRKKGEESPGEAVMGVLGLVAGIASAAVSVLALFSPRIRITLDIIVLYVFAGWLIVNGIGSIAASYKVKKEGFKGWIFTMILGIVVLIAGIYGIFHLISASQTMGYMIGILLMTYGIRMILSVFEGTGKNK